MFETLATTSLTYNDTTQKVLFCPLVHLCPGGVPTVFADPPATAVSSMLLVILYSILLTPGRCNLLGG